MNDSPRTFTKREAELHDHYARNAMACGHEATCRKVTDDINWPTMSHRSPCTCSHGGE